MRNAFQPLFAGLRLMALLAGLMLAASLHAQPTEDDVDNRYLFIFGVSSDMKSRVPLSQSAVRSVLLNELSLQSGGKLKSGDTVGVWTAGTELHTGEFPLQTWEPPLTGDIITNISAFVKKQTYKKDAHLELLWPKVDKLVKGSERLTLIIVCDGKSDFQGTPFDAGVNQMFKDHAAEARKNKTPFVVVIRSQLGQYVGCTVNFPPKPFQIPQFPALPEPPPKPKPKPKVEPAASPATNELPPVIVQPIVIVGTNVGTNAETLPKLPPKPPEPTNVAAVSVAPAVTNPPPANPLASAGETNPPAVFPSPVPATNAVMPPAASPNSGISSAMAFAIGGGLLVGAILLGIFAWTRKRRGSTPSIITRSIDRRR